jgi:hypothetical protein
LLRTVFTSVVFAVLCNSVVHAEPPPTKPFDWYGYDERQTACKLYDQELLECSQNSINCNQTMIDRLRRRCSSFRYDERQRSVRTGMLSHQQ